MENTEQTELSEDALRLQDEAKTLEELSEEIRNRLQEIHDVTEDPDISEEERGQILARLLKDARRQDEIMTRKSYQRANAKEMFGERW